MWKKIVPSFLSFLIVCVIYNYCELTMVALEYHRKKEDDGKMDVNDRIKVDLDVCDEADCEYWTFSR